MPNGKFLVPFVPIFLDGYDRACRARWFVMAMSQQEAFNLVLNKIEDAKLHEYLAFIQPEPSHYMPFSHVEQMQPDKHGVYSL